MSTPASLSFKGQATKHTTVKWGCPKNTDPLFTDPTIGPAGRFSKDPVTYRAQVAILETVIRLP